MIRSSLESKTYILQGTRTHGSFVVDLKRRKRAFLAGLAGLVIAALVFYRMRGFSFQWGLFLTTFQGIDWAWLLASILLMLLTYVGRALRWEVMLRPLGRTPGIGKLTA